MTITTGSTRTGRSGGPGARCMSCSTIDQYRLTLRPWHRMPARCRAARLDRELTGGASTDASAALAARSVQLTSTHYAAAWPRACSRY